MSRLSNRLEALRFMRVVPTALNELVRISKQTYYETFFEAFGDPDAYEAYVAEAFAPERLKAELADPDTAFYFATVGCHVVGYIKLNYLNSQTVFQGNKAAELERIYVLAAYHYQQIGRSLLEYAIDTVWDKGLDCLWLAVWEHNHKAVRFYERSGLTPFGTYSYEVAGDPQKDILMHIRLNDI